MNRSLTAGGAFKVEVLPGLIGVINPALEVVEQEVGAAEQRPCRVARISSFTSILHELRNQSNGMFSDFFALLLAGNGRQRDLVPRERWNEDSDPLLFRGLVL